MKAVAMASGGAIFALLLALAPAGPLASSARAPVAASSSVGQDATPVRMPPALEEAVRVVFSEFRVTEQYAYVMTGRLRFLFFWLSDEDVGEALVTLEESVARPELEGIRLRIGSDPEKAPRSINRWGAAAEIVERDRRQGAAAWTAFLGFMKATRGETVAAVEAELDAEAKERRYVFEASINYVDRTVALSSVLPIVSPVDFNIRQLKDAEATVLRQYDGAFPRSNFRILRDESRQACSSNASFLFTLKEMVDGATARQPGPLSRCFIYNSKPFVLSLQGRRAVAVEHVEYELHDGRLVQRDYADLIDLEFELRNPTEGTKETFELLVGTTAPLRGVPVRITYQPNFWFKAVLDLHRTCRPTTRPC